MSGLPLPNWNSPPFRPPLNHNGFIQRNQIQMNAFHQAPFPHFMPGFRPNFHPPPFHPEMMQGVGPLRTTQQQRHGNFGKDSDRNPCGPQGSSDQSFSCNACSRDFTSQEILNTHLKCHAQCSHSGCTFKASSKVLKLHFKEVHERGTFQITLGTPEEITKWREQRKRNYPTVANVAKKSEKKAKRRASGQVLQTKNYRYQKQRRGHHQGKNRTNRGRQNGNAARRDSKANQSEADPTGNVSTSTGGKSAVDGDPLSMLLGPCGSDDSDIETEKPIQERTPYSQSNSSATVTAASSTSALASLCSSYGNISSDEDDLNQEDANNNKEERKQPENAKSFEIKAKTERRKGRVRPRRLKTSRGKNCVSKGSSGRPTLLQMLLATEVRHERNVILQCLRFIVKRNFFGVQKQADQE